MTRDELAHILRAASQIADDPDVVVVGSQAILGTFDEDDLPERAATLPVGAVVRRRLENFVGAFMQG